MATGEMATSPPSIIVNETHESHASDSEDEENDVECESSLQIGFAEPVGDELMFENTNWKEWDGGRIGGKPFWLNPRTIPSPKTMECEYCKEPMSFVLQVYCPLDDVPGAFHRMVYLFCCRKASCGNKSSMKVLRSQLPRKNPFYAEIATDGATNSVVNKALCAVCGFNGPLTCSACKSESYCSKSHQRLAWKAHKAKCRQCKDGKVSIAKGGFQEATEVRHRYNCIFPEFEIEVCDADEINEVDEEKALALMKKEQGHRQEAEDTLKKLEQAKLAGVETSETVEEMTEMAKMRQKDIIAREGVESGAMRDQTTFNFMLAVSAAKDQVLRYDRWSGSNPLWIKSSNTLDSAPPCKCGAPRKFEFQVMPQLVHFLGVDAVGQESTTPAANLSTDELNVEKLKQISRETLDWGVLAVYTCTASCDLITPPSPPSQEDGNNSGEGSGYVEEFVYRQPPL